MIKLVFCMRRLPQLSPEEFQAYWRDKHIPLVKLHAAALRVAKYVTSAAVSDDINAAIRKGRGAPEPYDGVAEMYYQDEDTFKAAGRDPAAREALRQLLEDEKKFIDNANSPIFLVRESVNVG